MPNQLCSSRAKVSAMPESAWMQERPARGADLPRLFSKARRLNFGRAGASAPGALTGRTLQGSSSVRGRSCRCANVRSLRLKDMGVLLEDHQRRYFS
jgi:hypothetical protein